MSVRFGTLTSESSRRGFTHSFHRPPSCYERGVECLEKLLSPVISQGHAFTASLVLWAAQTRPWFDALLLPFAPVLSLMFGAIQRSRSQTNPFFPVMSSPKKHVLVLDLDETLVHTSHTPVAEYDLRIELLSRKSPVRAFFVQKRPFLDLFLEKLRKRYELVVFTASLREYADPVIDLLDRHRSIQRRFFREACSAQGDDFGKDLSIVTPNLSRVLLVDNSPAAYSKQQGNAVPIDAWFQDPYDQQLICLLQFLLGLSAVADVRSVLELRLSPLPPSAFPL